MAIRPFMDGNGRFARLVANWVLNRCGMPFVIAFCDTHEGRAAWRDAIFAGHRRAATIDLDNCADQVAPSTPLAGVIAAAIARAWTDIDADTEHHARARAEADGDKAVRDARTRAREETCSVCMDVGPNMTVLCCGAVYHLGCLTTWLASACDPACPACRQPISAPPLQPPRPSLFVGVPTGGTPIPGLDGPRRCAFCANMRATDCLLRACALCCMENQRTYGVRCLRHSIRGDWPFDGSATVEELPVIVTTPPVEQEPEPLVPADGSDVLRCTFCNNRRATGCAINACRNCCIMRATRCERHASRWSMMAPRPAASSGGDMLRPPPPSGSQTRPMPGSASPPPPPLPPPNQAPRMPRQRTAPRSHGVPLLNLQAEYV